MARILGVDWGERRVGLAVSDPLGLIATGLETLEVRGVDHAVQQVSSVAAELEVEALVVGMPLLLSGERGAAARSAEKFASALRAATGLPVTTWDERLTSAMASRRLREHGGRSRRAKGLVDRGAAVVLLESYLQRLASGHPPDTV